MDGVQFWSFLGRWLIKASPVPVRIAEIAFLIITIVALAVRQFLPQQEPTMMQLLWIIPLGLLVAIFIVSMIWTAWGMYKEQKTTISGLNAKIVDLNGQLEVARKQAYPPVTTLMMTSYFKDLDIPIGDYGLVNRTIEDKVFDCCRIKGPVVIVIQPDCLLTHCTFEGDIETTLIVTTNKSMVGVLGVSRCKFITCIFENVGIIGSQEIIDHIKQGFSNK